MTALLRSSADSSALLGQIPLSSRETNALAANLERAGHDAAADEISQLAAIELAFRESLRGHGGRHNIGQSDDGIMAPDQGLQQARAVLKVLQHDASARSSLPSDADSNLTILAASLKTLVDIAAKRLVTTRQQKMDLEIEFKNKQSRIDNAEREVTLLREELSKQRQLRAKQMAELDASLTKVKDELVSAQKVAEAELKEMQTAGSNKLSSISDSHAKNEGSLAAQMEKLQATLKESAEKHVDAEANLRKRKVRSRLEVETLVKDYDAAMAAVQEKIDGVLVETKSETAPLVDLKQYYVKINAELARLADEDEIEFDRYFREVTVVRFVSSICLRELQPHCAVVLAVQQGLDVVRLRSCCIRDRCAPTPFVT